MKAPTSATTPTGGGSILMVGGTCAMMPVATSSTRCVVPIGYIDTNVPWCWTLMCAVTIVASTIVVRSPSASSVLSVPTSVLGRLSIDVSPDVRLLPGSGGHLAGAVCEDNLVVPPTSVMVTAAGCSGLTMTVHVTNRFCVPELT